MIRTVNMLHRWKIIAIARKIWSSIWTMILLFVGIIWVIYFSFMKFLSDEPSLNSLAYLLAASAIAVGGCVAYHHLRIIQGTERASVLTNLDTVWMSSELENTRVSLLKFQKEFKAIEDDEKREVYIKNKLRKTRRSNQKRYRELIAMVGFFETIGYFSRVRYILPIDAIELYGPAIRDNDEAFHGHIVELRNDSKDEELYANFLWLADKAKLK